MFYKLVLELSYIKRLMSGSGVEDHTSLTDGKIYNTMQPCIRLILHTSGYNSKV